MRRFTASAPIVRGRRPRTEIPPAVVYLATAAPIEQAEAELRLRFKKNPRVASEPDPDYVEYPAMPTASDSLVLAIAYPDARRIRECARRASGWRRNPSC